MNEVTPSKLSYMLAAGYWALGLLIGYLSGITSSEITKTIITPLLVLIGGKVLTDIGKKDRHQLRTMGAVLLAFSLSFLIGINAGIYVKVNRSLSGSEASNVATGKKDTPYTYLRSDSVRDDIRDRYDRGEISKDSIVKLYFARSKR